MIPFGYGVPGTVAEAMPSPWAWHAAADAAVSDVVTAALLTFGSPGGLVLAMSRFEKRKKTGKKKRTRMPSCFLWKRGWGGRGGDQSSGILTGAGCRSDGTGAHQRFFFLLAGN